LANDRKDFVFVNFDFRDTWLTDDSHELLHGVTMAPPSHLKASSRVDPTETPKYLLTFRGGRHPGWFSSATVRPDLERLWSLTQVHGTVVEFLPRRHNYTDDDKKRYSDLLNTVFALVPHGDGRWNYRL